MGPTSATLNANGRTDSTPGHYYFQYSTAANALGTAYQVQTPTRGPIPAHTSGPNNSLLPIAESVSGLKSGTTYYFRACGGDTASPVDGCGHTLSFTTLPGTVSYPAPGTYSWTVPAGVTRAQFDVSGAEGAAGVYPTTPPTSVAGGEGARERATLTVTPGATLTIVVGNGAVTITPNPPAC